MDEGWMKEVRSGQREFEEEYYIGDNTLVRIFFDYNEGQKQIINPADIAQPEIEPEVIINRVLLANPLLLSELTAIAGLPSSFITSFLPPIND